MSGCYEENKQSVGDVLLVQRLDQVVRAVEPRSGTERWNFSVAQHDIRLVSECHILSEKNPRLLLRAVLPDGLLSSFDPERPTKTIWQHKVSM